MTTEELMERKEQHENEVEVIAAELRKRIQK